MGNISNLIRSRLKFRRHVKTLTAEGRMSGYVLVGLPICMFAYLYFANYDYVSLLWRDPLGPFMLGGGILLQVIGSIAIWKITDIEL